MHIKKKVGHVPGVTTDGMWDVLRNPVITKYKIIPSEGQPSLAHDNLLDHIVIVMAVHGMWDVQAK